MKTFAHYFVAVLLAFALAGCQPAKPNSQVQEQRAIESNQQRLITAVPPPVLDYSQERKNLVERLKRINAQNMTGFIYLISHGQVMAYYPVRGKVTSLNAYLMGSTKIMDDPNGDFSAGSLQIEQPDFDGAYGKNSDGIFFFTADTNAYVEWFGEYLWSDQPLALSQQPLMVREVN